MDARISRVLDQLTAESLQEKRHERSIPQRERMLAITEDTGKFLNILVRSMKFSDVLEVGTSVGYSTIWLAEAAFHNGGIVTTIERSHAKVIKARRNIEEAGITNVEILEGEAAEILPSLRNTFDFALIDADKENVAWYFERILDILRQGGVITVDNMLYPEKYRGVMDGLARRIRTECRVRTVTVPIGNGVEMAFKI